MHFAVENGIHGNNSPTDCRRNSINISACWDLRVVRSAEGCSRFTPMTSSRYRHLKRHTSPCHLNYLQPSKRRGYEPTDCPASSRCLDRLVMRLPDIAEASDAVPITAAVEINSNSHTSKRTTQKFSKTCDGGIPWSDALVAIRIPCAIAACSNNSI
jgi:hypothetical protein